MLFTFPLIIPSYDFPEAICFSHKICDKPMFSVTARYKVALHFEESWLDGCLVYWLGIAFIIPFINQRYVSTSLYKVFRKSEKFN